MTVSFREGINFKFPLVAMMAKNEGNPCGNPPQNQDIHRKPLLMSNPTNQLKLVVGGLSQCKGFLQGFLYVHTSPVQGSLNHWWVVNPVVFCTSYVHLIDVKICGLPHAFAPKQVMLNPPKKLAHSSQTLFFDCFSCVCKSFVFFGTSRIESREL